MAFCSRANPGAERGLTFDDLSKAIAAIRDRFAIVAGPTVNLLHDPEIDGLSYVVVEITIQAKPQEALAAHRAFARKMVQLLGPRREFLKLHYQIA